MTDLLKLGARAATAISDAVAQGDWGEAERLIRRGHRAAYLAGLAERLNVPLDSALLSEKRLSRAERKDVDRLIDAELKYWKGFESEKADLSEGQTNARAAMYGRATRKTYFQSRWSEWDIPPELMPGNQACLSNCGCWIRVSDNGDGTGVLTRTMGKEKHCKECPPLAGDHPVTKRGA